VAHLADRGDMAHKNPVHIWPGAFIVCPGSSIGTQVHVPVWKSAFHLKHTLCFRCCVCNISLHL